MDENDGLRIRPSYKKRHGFKRREVIREGEEYKKAYFMEISFPPNECPKLFGRFRTEADALCALQEAREAHQTNDCDSKVIISKGLSNYRNTDIYEEILYRVTIDHKIESTNE